ncbi:MAG: polysaccharide deacetylase family protein [Clostridia bacterium]|nr:polysaccharide deacetylase family protein [Clostridia bacterium]
MRRFLSFLLILMLIIPTACAADKYSTMPKALKVKYKNTRTDTSSTCFIMRYYVDTCLDSVDAEVRKVIDRLAEENRSYLPKKSAMKDESAMLEAGSTIYRTGTKWMSFLMTASVMNGTKQLSMSFDTLAYDMETGKKLTLDSVLLSDEKGWEYVRQETARQLSEYFPQYKVNQDKLNALCGSNDALRKADFTLSPAFLQLHFASESLYKKSGVIMHVRIPYTDLAPYLTKAAKTQTDNSRFKLVALTYDDGPTRKHTNTIIRALRSGGLNATFFLVGERIAGANDLVMLEHNAGFTVASHNYVHVYTSQMRGKVHEYRKKMDNELIALIGKGVPFMRAPGGKEEVYLDEKVGLPLIHWSLHSKDGTSSDFDISKEAVRLAYAADDGSILLMHDLRSISAKYTQLLPQLFNDEGFLCVTIEELFHLKGIPLKANTVYNSAR